MFVDLSDIEDGSALDFDLCIIGAGAAGITLALEQAGSSTRVCVLEAGGFDFDSDTQEMYEGSVSGVDYLPLDSVRLRYFGGTTNHWAGQSTPLDPIDFQKRDWVKSSGWPISFDEFSRYLERARNVCKLGKEDFSWDGWQERSNLAAFPFPGGRFEPVVFRHPEPITRFGEAYREAIKVSRNVICILHANVLQLESNETGTQVTAARIAGLDGRRALVRSRYFIIATGGIENARLLLVSGPEGGPGLGNERDLVGRYFMEHPNFGVGEVVLGDKGDAPILAQPKFRVEGRRFRIDFKLNAARQAELEILNHSMFLMPMSGSGNQIGKDTQFLSRAWNRVEQFFDIEPSVASYSLRLRLEHMPQRESRVTLSDQVDVFGSPKANLHLTFGGLEARTLRSAQEALAIELGQTGLGRMRIEDDVIEEKWPAEAGWQVHHCGGTRMSSSSDTGVVDENCRIHGVSNVFVAGSSVFPTCGHANPTMNLLALTLRLSDHIKEELLK